MVPLRTSACETTELVGDLNSDAGQPVGLTRRVGAPVIARRRLFVSAVSLLPRRTGTLGNSGRGESPLFLFMAFVAHEV